MSDPYGSGNYPTDPFGDWAPGYSGYYNLGPVIIPPRVTYVALTDRVTGAVLYMGQNGTAVVLTATNPGSGVQFDTFPAFSEPFLPHGLRIFAASGALQSEDLSPEVNLSGPVWLYNTANPNQQTWPEPTNIPTPPPPVIPGIPSSAPPPTGGGYAAWVANFPNNLPRQLTTILTTGNVKNVAWWNGTAWITPSGTALVGIM